MFKVKTEIGTELTVYAVNTNETGIWFLIYTFDSWAWVPAKYYKPVE